MSRYLIGRRFFFLQITQGFRDMFALEINARFGNLINSRVRYTRKLYLQFRIKRFVMVFEMILFYC